MNIYLISEETLKSESYINDNLDPAMILPSIQTAQDMHLQPLIGTKLYKTLMGMVKDNNIEGYYKVLMDEYIRPFLIYAVLTDIQIPLAFKQRNAGIIQTNNEYVNNSFMNDVQAIKSYYENKMNFYGLRLSDWLKANSNNIKEYCGKDDCSQMKADPHSYNTGICLV
jgi:hypothetical protein